MATKKEVSEVDEQVKDQGNHQTEIWQYAFEPPKDALKDVQFGRRFTSIDAYWIIQKLTERFGPIGMGWGIESPEYTFRPGFTHPTTKACSEVMTIHAKFWYGRSPGENYINRIPISDSIIWKGTQGNPPKLFVDDEAEKKLMTGIISKAASYLGFGAFIFQSRHEGKYADEDNQIVHDSDAPQRVENPPTPPEPRNSGVEPRSEDRDIIKRLEKRADEAGAQEALSMGLDGNLSGVAKSYSKWCGYKTGVKRGKCAGLTWDQMYDGATVGGMRFQTLQWMVETWKTGVNVDRAKVLIYWIEQRQPEDQPEPPNSPEDQEIAPPGEESFEGYQA